MKEIIATQTTKIKQRKKTVKTIKLILLVFILLLLLIYLIVSLIYSNENFSITLDENLYFDKNLIIYDDPQYKVYRSELYAEAPEVFDNISYKWLPENLTETDGSHNGNNYLAYTFYVENIGDKISDYWSEILIDDVIKNVDQVVRVRVYKNDEYVTYAKASAFGTPEKNTVAFETEELIARDHVERIIPGEIIKYTIVLWLEGSDPECTNNIFGGEIKIHMEFNSEFIEK